MIVDRKLSLAAAVAVCALAGAASAQPAGSVLTGAAAFGDYTADKPGMVRKIAPGDLTAPAPAESVPRFPKVAPRPASAQIQTLPGFAVARYTDQLANPRTLRLAPTATCSWPRPPWAR